MRDATELFSNHSSRWKDTREYTMHRHKNKHNLAASNNAGSTLPHEDDLLPVTCTERKNAKLVSKTNCFCTDNTKNSGGFETRAMSSEYFCQHNLHKVRSMQSCFALNSNQCEMRSKVNPSSVVQISTNEFFSSNHKFSEWFNLPSPKAISLIRTRNVCLLEDFGASLPKHSNFVISPPIAILKSVNSVTNSMWFDSKYVPKPSDNPTSSLTSYDSTENLQNLKENLKTVCICSCIPVFATPNFKSAIESGGHDFDHKGTTLPQESLVASEGSTFLQEILVANEGTTSAEVGLGGSSSVGRDCGTSDSLVRPMRSRHHALWPSAAADWWRRGGVGWLGMILLLLYTGCAVCEVHFSGGIRNETVTLGRDASLSCTVEGLGNHKVGWIHLKRQMIVAVHTRMITRISRYSVTHEDNKTWTLHINGVREEDRGYYMCQVNTKPALSQVGHLTVVVPPTIVDEESSDSEIQVREKKNVTLRCSGRGRPAPRLMWRREDGGMIVPDDRNPVTQVDGEVLELSSVSRTHMGSYLCIASNGVPPSVSKRITLKVEFPPQIHVPNQLVGVPTGDNVTIDCHVEAFPQAISYWVRDKVMVMNDAKYKTETKERLYKIDMRLTVFNFSADDSRTYKCVAKNSLGETEGDIRLNEIYTPPKLDEIRSNGDTDESASRHNTAEDRFSGVAVGRGSVEADGALEIEVVRPQNGPDLIRDVNYFEDGAVPHTSFPRQADFPFASGAASSLRPGEGILAPASAVSTHILASALDLLQSGISFFGDGGSNSAPISSPNSAPVSLFFTPFALPSITTPSAALDFLVTALSLHWLPIFSVVQTLLLAALCH